MQTGSDKTFHLKWNNHLQNLSQLFAAIYTSSALADVTLACRDGTLRAHKLVLSACSPYFEQIFKDNPCKHPVVILKGIPYSEINLLVEFMYKGAVDVQELDLQSLMHTAAELEIRGLAYEVRANAAQLLNVNLEYPAYTSPPGVSLQAAPSRDYRPPEQTRADLERLKQIHLYQQSMRTDNADPKRKRRDDPMPSNTTAAVQNILAAAAKELADTGAPARAAACVQTEAGEALVKSESLQMEDETWAKPKKRVSFFTPEEDKQRKRKLHYTIKQSPQHEPPADDAVGKLVISAVSGGEGGAGAAECRSEEAPRPSGIKVVQLSALQGPSREELSDDEEGGGLLEERRGSAGADEEEESCSSGGSVPEAARATRPHVCDVCDLRFQRASHLSRHRLTHTGERPFSCGGCGKSFARSDKLRVHTKICESEDPTVEMSEEGGGGGGAGGGRVRSEVMSGMVRMTHRESSQLMFTPSGDVILPPRHSNAPYLTAAAHNNTSLDSVKSEGWSSEGGGGGGGETPAKRGRGRPRKPVLDNQPKIKKRRGRPPKLHSDLDMMLGLSVGNGGGAGMMAGGGSAGLAGGGGAGLAGGGGTVPLQQHVTPAGHQYIVKRKRGRPPKNYFNPLPGSALADHRYYERSHPGEYKTYGRPKENYNATNLPFGDFSYLTEMMYSPAALAAAAAAGYAPPSHAHPHSPYPHVTTVDPEQDVDLDTDPRAPTHSPSSSDEEDGDDAPGAICETEIITLGDCQIVKLPQPVAAEEPAAAVAPARPSRQEEEDEAPRPAPDPPAYVPTENGTAELTITPVPNVGDCTVQPLDTHS